jgi:fatty-acyl-CoA synthase
MTVEMHLASIWETIADEVGDEPALVHGDRRVTWREFDDRAARLCNGLAAAGLRPGSVVAIDLYNAPEFLEVFYAAIKGGFVPTMVNYRYRAAELVHLLRDAAAEIVVAHPGLDGAVRDIADQVPSLRRVLVVGEDDAELVDDHAPAARRRRADEGTMLSYTGGTTGMPKGVVYGMPRLAAQAMRTRAMVAGVDVDPEAPPSDVARDLHARGIAPVCCPASPLMHSTAFTFVSLPTLTAGGTIVTLENRRFDAGSLLDAVERHGVTATAVVGDAFARPIVAELDGRAASGSPRGGTLRVMCSAGVAFSADTKRRLLAHLPQLTIVDACGSTEGATYGVSVVRAGDDLSTVSFQPASGTIVVDEQRRPVPDGQVGFISSVTVTSGYHAQPEKTAAAFYEDDDGEWRVVPGDFGRIEDDGSLTLLGRGSSVINTGGEKVHPEEVEDVIKTLAAVVDAVVWAVPDERLGSSVGAVVQPVEDAAIDEDAVREHVRRRLAGYKAPRRVVFVDRIPRHANGKLDTAEVTTLLGDGA